MSDLAFSDDTSADAWINDDDGNIITEAGTVNVGIGVDEPNAKLDVKNKMGRPLKGSSSTKTPFL